jgi:hypothetical protein
MKSNTRRLAPPTDAWQVRGHRITFWGGQNQLDQLLRTGEARAIPWLENKIGRVFAVEQLLPLKDRFGFATGAGVVLTIFRKRGSRQNSKRVAVCFLDHCECNFGVSEIVAALGALEHPAWHLRISPFR